MIANKFQAALFALAAALALALFPLAPGATAPTVAPASQAKEQGGKLPTLFIVVAKSEKALFIDINRLIMAKYAAMTPADIKSKYFTAADNTHTSAAGAELNAACVAEGIRALQDCPLGKFLK